MSEHEEDFSTETNDVEFILDLVKVLDKHFEPNQYLDAEDADYKSTAEIGEMIDSHIGEKVDRSLIRMALTQAGFKYKLIGTKFYWSMRRRRASLD